MKLKHSTMLALGGLVWLAVGLYLLPLGLKFLTEQSLIPPPSAPLLNFLGSFLSQGNAIVILIASGLFVGYFKGRYVLGKSAERESARIKALPNPAPVQQLYSKRFYILVALMMGIGMAMRLVPLDVRGWVDVAVGAALINGSVVYFKRAIKA